MSASLGLFRLQQIDSRMERLRAQMEKIRQTLENDAELKEALEKRETAQAERFRAANSLKNAEAETRAQKIKIEQTEASLYGGGVKNPKELQDLEKDAASLKKHLTALEERELQALLTLEEAEKTLQDAQTRLELLNARRGSEHKKLLEERERLAAELASLTEERNAAGAPVETALLERYEELRRDKRGIAVAEISDSACGSCGASVNAALAQSARSSKLTFCPSCGRILYAR